MAIEYTNALRAGTDLLIKSKSSVSQRQADFGSAPVNLNWNARPRAVGCWRVPAVVARARHHRPEPRGRGRVRAWTCSTSSTRVWPNWAAADSVVTLRPASGATIEVRLNEPDDRALMCGVAMIEQSRTGSLTVRREIRYLDGGQQRLDQEYGWA